MQHVTLTQRQSVLSYTLAFIFIIAMIAIASFFDDREIILPEIAAMAVALWVYREQNWMRHPEKIFIWPTITALLGFGINLLSIPFTTKLILILASMLLFFLLFRYSLAPALATGFLPIVTNATEISFIISILVTTFILMFLVIFAKFKITPDRNVTLQPKLMGIYAVIVLISIGVASIFNYAHLAVLPPIAVVIYESLYMKMYSLRILLKQTIVLTLSATIGVLLYFYVVNWIAVILLTMPLMWLLLHLFNMRIPAVYAFPLLAYVFPQEALPLLPIASLLVSLLSLGLVLGYRKMQGTTMSIMQQK
ncbi:hypothetical protein I4632_09615 [Proteus mirabilis]|uniref:hypothetical protein n=1 Tax=Proteus sp. fly-1067 TaxID=3136674 RepID=UPI0018C5BC9A|nr:hypothetical protein [Proteus mirabilis]